jgi:hypothetical protein
MNAAMGLSLWQGFRGPEKAKTRECGSFHMARDQNERSEFRKYLMNRQRRF